MYLDTVIIINAALTIAMFFSSVNAQLQAQSCSISCPGNPTLSGIQPDNEHRKQTGPQGKRGVMGPPGPAGTQGRKGAKGEQGNALLDGGVLKVLQDEIEALRISMTEVKRSFCYFIFCYSLLGTNIFCF